MSLKEDFKMKIETGELTEENYNNNEFYSSDDENQKISSLKLLIGLFIATLVAIGIYIFTSIPLLRTYYYAMAIGEVLFIYLLYLIIRRFIARHKKTSRIKSFLFYLIMFLAAALGNSIVTEIGRSADPYTMIPSFLNFLGIWIIPIAVFIISDKLRLSYQTKDN